MGSKGICLAQTKIDRIRKGGGGDAPGIYGLKAFGWGKAQNTFLQICLGFSVVVSE